MCFFLDNLELSGLIDKSDYFDLKKSDLGLDTSLGLSLNTGLGLNTSLGLLLIHAWACIRVWAWA